MRVCLRRRQSSRCQLPIVARVNQVVRDTGMLRIRLKQRLEQFSRLLLPCMRFVGRRRVGQKRQSIKHLRFDIFGIRRCQRGHGSFIVQSARRIRNSPSVLKYQARCPNKAGFTFRSCLCAQGLPDFLLRNGNRSWRNRRFPQLVIGTHGDAPVGHRAVGISICHAPECLRRSVVRKRVKQRNGSIEFLLHGGIAGRRERHFSQSLRCRMIMFLCGDRQRKDQTSQEYSRDR